MAYRKISKKEAVHYTWGNMCNSWVFVDNDALSVKLESMPPNTRESAHYHEKASQFFYLTKGEAVFHINDDEIKVSSLEGIEILPQTVHYIENNSNETIYFLVVSQPTTNKDRIEKE